ncbi:hypothetical protein ACP70R_049456 [Stipagrostis hirtigluma subsp. patula]
MAGVLLIILSFLLVLPSAMAIGQVCGNAGNYTANGPTAPTSPTLPPSPPPSPPTPPPPLSYSPPPPPANPPTRSTRSRSAAATSPATSPGAPPASRTRSRTRRRCAPTPRPPASNNITGDMSTLFQYWNPASITGDATAVAAGVNDLLTQTARVAAATSPRRFATAFMDGSGGSIPTLYSLAQCTPDLSAGDCLACLQRIVGVVNATTSVRLGGRVLVLRCNFRFENMMFYEGAPMTRITPSSSGPPASPFPAPATNKRMKPWVIVVSVAPPLAVVALCFIFYCRWRRRKYRKGRPRLRRKPTHNRLRGGEEPDWEMEADLSEFSVFDFHQILEATNNFSEENKLGEGGFGPVYKGQFPEGVEIAVKRLASHSGQGFIEFKNEVQLIAKLQHTNLVRLLGCCSQEEEKILVYEYLPNKSLDFFIFDEDRKSLLDWNKRLAIIEGTAEGLLYLHKHSRLRVIHRDLKPSNILLDSEMNPKISDFGLAKIFSSNNNEGGTTRRVVGTYGYMAPEYASEGLFSIKSDVFSFGVLILEIISGKRNSNIHDCGDFINILGYTWQLFEEGRWRELVDASLLSMHHSDEMIMRCMNIGLLCVQENAVDRPTMLDVVAMLSSKTKILAKPNHPAYFNVRVGNGEASTTATTVSGLSIR